MLRRTRTDKSERNVSSRIIPPSIGLMLCAISIFAFVYAFAPTTSFALSGDKANQNGADSSRVASINSDNNVDYLCFTAQEAGCSITLNWISAEGDEPAKGQAWKISTDKITWLDYEVGEAISLAQAGDKVYWRAKDDGNKTLSQEAAKYFQFSLGGKVAASGSIMTLLDATDTRRTLKGDGKYCFYNLFLNCTSLTSAPALPATIVASSCYCHMFEGCTSLEIAPDLPAAELSSYCYMNMFYGCTSLTSMPLIGGGNDITFDADCCCKSMFEGCSALAVYKTAGSEREHKLSCSAVTGKGSTSNMFDGCSDAGDYNTANPAPKDNAFACYGGIDSKDATVSYSTHVENEGWQEAVENGKVSGTSGKAYRLESIKINLDEASLEGIEGGISYRTHVQNEGWQDWVADGAESGTTGKALRLEAIQIQLTGDMADLYDVYYRVHAQNIGWMGWAKNGEEAGTEGYAYRLEAIQIVLIEKGGAAPGDVESIHSVVDYAYLSSSEGPSDPYRDELVSYNTHVQNIGWKEYSKMGGVAGTFSEALRLEGIHIKLGGAAAALNGSIEYRTHVQNIGWQTYVADGEMSGTSGKAYRLEAINIRLTDEVAAAYDVYYRVHAQNIGWMAWAKNDESAGTAGYAYRLEAIQIVLVEKGGPAPAVDYGGIASVVEDAFMEADE